MGKLLRFLKLALLAASLMVLTSCGGGGGGGGSVNNTGGNTGPSQVALVEVSSAGSSSIDVSWLPAMDSATPASEMKYQVHASTDLTYTPDSATLKAEGTGILSARLTGLQAATRYTVVLVATNAAGHSTVSSPLTVTTSALNSETIPGVVIATPTDAQIAAVADNQITLTADAAAPQVGQFIASTQGDGFLRQVTQVNTVSGQTVVQTQPASLNQVANNVEISSAFNMTSVPAEVAPTQAGVVVEPSSAQIGSAEWKWPQTNFRMSSTPVKRNASNAQGSLQVGVTSSSSSNIDVSTKLVSKVGSWASFTGPDTVGILTGTSGAVNLNLDVTNDDATTWSGTRIPIAICKVEVILTDDPPGLITVGSMTPTETEMVGDYSAIRHATQGITINAKDVAARAKPYVVILRAYIDEAGNHCQEDYRFFLGWKERLDIPINVAVVSTPNFPQAESKPLDFTGDFSVHNDVTFTFDPTLEAEVKLNGAKLNYARLETKTRAALAQKLTVTATGAGTIDKTQTLISSRKFVKVYMAGTVPIVMSGEFAADLRVQGNVTGAITATEEVKFSLEDMTYGVIYENGAWHTTQNVRPTYELKLAGNGDAEAHLTLSLVPRLSIKFYEAATGRLVVSPYLQADAGVHGQVLADITPAGTTTDADYWLTQGKISGGVDAYLMADLTVLDYTFVKWPSTANIADYTTYKKIPLIPNSPVVIAGLPSLTASYDDTTKHPTDSRAFLIRGRAIDVANPFKGLFGGPDAFLPFANWTAPKVIALNNAGYIFVPSPTGSDPGDVWIALTNPGTYTVRLGGNSSMGGWARQVAEVVVNVTDSNNNGIIDQWETKYGITDSAADPDADGKTNLQEWLVGSNPKMKDYNLPPMAVFFSNTANGLQVSFDASLSSDSDGTIVSHGWDFGDVHGQIGVEKTVIHTYASAGTYTVTLNVLDDKGDFASASSIVTVTSSNTTPDTTPPTVSSTSPANIATGVAVNTAITATFSETMDASTVSPATFTLNNGVTGTVTYSGTTATFTPSSNLAYSTTYTATISTGVKDSAGNAMSAAYTWIFTTGTGAAAMYNAISIAVGDSHSVSLKSDGTVWAWGHNYYGRLGDGTTTTRYTPVQVSNLSGITAIDGGGYHTIALKNDGTVWAWGYNGAGRLGDGTTTTRYTPVQVSNLSGITAVDSGSHHSLALKNDGTVWAWGNNGEGQLGDGTMTSRDTPVQVSGLTGITAIDGGGYHTIALKNDGTVWAWGYNGEGQLGGGATNNHLTPVQVSNLSGITAVASGEMHTIALKSDGTVWALGYNYYGQLGDGTTTTSYTPIPPAQVSNLSGITAVDSGLIHSIALKNDGTVWAWGFNGAGQLGDGTTADHYTPVQVSNLSGIAAIAGGWEHTIALKNDGTVWAWGNNGEGQLGDGTTTSRYTPVQVDATPAVSASAPGANFKMPDTNQTTSYTNTFGEDHDYTINPPSYTDNGDGTVTDNVTGLVWQKQDDATARTWYNAITYCSNLTLAGQTSWRLPSRIELLSIVDSGTYNPSINGTYFPSTKSSSYYWSSTALAAETSAARDVSFYTGSTNNYWKLAADQYVRCVRGGQNTPSLTDNGNGTVTDSGTLLTWQQGESSAMTWEASLSYCEGLSLAAQTDWRLPNIKELSSIVDDTRVRPSINTTLFPNATSSYYWSSTTRANEASSARGVALNWGETWSFNKTDSNYARCVRGGQ